MTRVAIVTDPFGETDRAPIDALEGAGVELVWGPRGRKPDPDETAVLCRGARAVIAGAERYDAALLDRLGDVGLIARTGIGLDGIDLEAARARGIAVTHTPDGPSDSVAELTIGLILTAARQIARADREIRAGRWTRRTGVLLRGRTVGVVGLGRCGSRVARLLRPFGCGVLGVDIDAAAAARAAAEEVVIVDLPTLLARSDVVTLHVPATPETRGLLDEAALSSMKAGAVLVNTSRGTVVDEAALERALARGHLGGAALDVFASEPYRGSLTAREDVVLTAHMASCTDVGRRLMEVGAAEAVLAFLAGRPLPHRVA